MTSWKNSLVMMLLFLGLAGPACAQGIAGDDSDEAIVLGRRLSVHSERLDTDLTLLVYLPPGYDESEERYPVIITVRDLFHFTSGTIHGWNNWGHIPPIIVVSFTGLSSNLFNPTVGGNNLGGGADSLIEAMRVEILPWIDSNFRTQPYRILHGGSSAGLFAVYAVMMAPELFDAAIAAGPWLVYDEDQRYILTHAEEILSNHQYQGNFVYFTGGDQSDLVPSLLELKGILEKGSPEGFEWIYEPMESYDHAELTFHTLISGLRTLYLGWRWIPEGVAAGGAEAIVNYRDGLNAKFGYEIGLAPGAVASTGWRLFQADRKDEAFEIFKVNIELNPNMARAYFALGRALDREGDLEGAKENYEQALAKVPDYESSRRQMYEDFVTSINEKIAAESEN